MFTLTVHGRTLIKLSNLGIKDIFKICLRFLGHYFEYKLSPVTELSIFLRFML